MRIIDLSFTLDEEKWMPRPMRNRISHTGHLKSLALIFLGFKLLPKHLKSGLGWANDRICPVSYTHLRAHET